VAVAWLRVLACTHVALIPPASCRVPVASLEDEAPSARPRWHAELWGPNLVCHWWGPLFTINSFLPLNMNEIFYFNSLEYELTCIVQVIKNSIVFKNCEIIGNFWKKVKRFRMNYKLSLKNLRNFVVGLYCSVEHPGWCNPKFHVILWWQY